MNNIEFLEKVKESFYKYLETGSRSNKKLKILHGSIAADIERILGEGYKISSLGLGNGKEKEMKGRYMDKKVDICIEKDNETIASIALKFIMRNYHQNSNNYFENMLGETANIRSAGKPYFQIVIIPSKVPYFNSDKKISKIEPITSHLSKYINLSNDNTDTYMHTPNKTLIYLIDMPAPEIGLTFDEYIKYYQNLKFTITPNKTSYKFGSTVIYNNYEEFIKKITHLILSI